VLGRNQAGPLGYNRTDNLGDGEAVTSWGFVTLGDLAVKIAAGGDHTRAVLQSGALRCWGTTLDSSAMATPSTSVTPSPSTTCPTSR
jgi:alpha-tubulin suppressor-like RCC1 family protein